MIYIKVDRDELTMEDAINAFRVIADSLEKGYTKGSGWEVTGENEPPVQDEI